MEKNNNAGWTGVWNQLSLIRSMTQVQILLPLLIAPVNGERSGSFPDTDRFDSDRRHKIWALSVKWLGAPCLHHGGLGSGPKRSTYYYKGL